ncbi:ATP-binding protein [Streptomyces olivochromogenes]|uniref:ATP-binding protein n=1 Tax=Streptomyces olivochromogenes TaxID=1963 RepID=UPI001F2B654C|nr:ATP-binding protein [Streptomyces olivochromogenes]MCF3132556.1 ATP-binding protein [Streptomyces olivochromogenes]
MNAGNELPCHRDQFYARDRRSAPAARRFAWWTSKYWGLYDWERADDITLCVTELATNALLHGVPPGRGFLLRLRYDGDVFRVEVHDSGSGTPRVADEADEGGRGLLLVAALADKWGVGERGLGKAVWCEFARPAVGGRWPGP